MMSIRVSNKGCSLKGHRRFYVLLLAMVFLLAGSTSAFASTGSINNIKSAAINEPALTQPALAQEHRFAERTLVITLSTEDPCKKILSHLPTQAKGRQFSLGGQSLNGDMFLLSACQKMRKDIEGAAQAWLDDITGYSATQKQFNAGIEAVKRDVYAYFLQYVAEQVYTILPPEEQARFSPTSPAAQQKALEWLHQPENEIRTYVHAFLESKSKPLARIFKDYMSGASMEIITGLKGLLDSAKSKLERFTKMQEEAEKTDTKIGDLLEKYGFSGEYLDKFKSYEGRIKGLNKSYRIKEAVGVISGAFQTDIPDQKIAGMMDLLVLVGGVAEDSRIPIVSLFGQIVKTYGEVGKEMLNRVLGLEKILREREGYCIGLATHSKRDPKNTAFIESFGHGFRACPVAMDGHLANIFTQAQPQDINQLYFWTGDKFVKGQPGGGGQPGMRAAIQIILNGDRLGYAAFSGKAQDIATIADVYNTPYPKDKLRGKKRTHQSGVLGLREEARIVIDTLSRQVKALRNGVNPYGAPSCTIEKMEALIDKEAGQNTAQFMERLHLSESELKQSYTLSFVEQYRMGKQGDPRRTAAYKTYSRFYDKTHDLSLFKVSGQVVDSKQPGKPCLQCGNASVEISVSNARELAGCEVDRADAKGRFVAHLITRSTEVHAQVSARAGDVSSETFPINPKKLGIDVNDTPFIRSFSLNLPLDFGDEDSNGKPEGETGGGISIENIVGQLENVAAQAQTLSKQINQACQVLSGMGQVESGIKKVESEFSGLLPKLSKIEQDIKNRQKTIASIRRMADQATASSESIIRAKNIAEKEALFACQTAESLQKKKGNPKNLIPQAEKAGREAQRQAGLAKTSYQKSRDLASQAEAQSKAIGGLEKQARSIQQSANDLPGTLKSLQSQLEQIEQANAGIKTTREQLLALKPRAEALMAQGRSELEALPESAQAQHSQRLDSAFGQVVSHMKTTPCDEGVADKLVILGEQLTSSNARFKQLQPRLNALNSAMTADSTELNDIIPRIKATADTGEIFAEAAESVAADAAKCVVLARAMAKDGPDKIADTARVAIAACEFKNAKGLIKQLGNDPRRIDLETLFQQRRRHEGRTKTLFTEADQLFQQNQFEQALALLKEARGHTKCDKFSSRIETAIGKIEARVQTEESEEDSDQKTANTHCTAIKPGSVGKRNPDTGNYDCRCQKNRVESPDGNSCINRSAVAGQDRDLQPDSPEEFAVGFRINILTPTQKPERLKIPKGADSKTRKRIRKRNKELMEAFINSLSLSNTRPTPAKSMPVPLIIMFTPKAQETFPRDAFTPGAKFSMSVAGMVPDEKGTTPLNTAILLDVVRTFDSAEEVMAAYPTPPGNKKGLQVNQFRNQSIIRDSSGTFTIESPESGKITMGPLVNGWTSANQHKALQLTKKMFRMAGEITCFVATAVYEDPLSKQIATLRAFRDDVLMSSNSGTRLVQLYYQYGPGWARWVMEHPIVTSPLQTMFDAGVTWLETTDLNDTWHKDAVDNLVSLLDTISSWFTDEADYKEPASAGVLWELVTVAKSNRSR